MSCVFCGYKNHVSQNCDFYFSDEERKEALNLKNRCPKCLTVCDEYVYYSPYKYANQRSVANVENDANSANKITGINYCKNCEFNEKCYICFSKDHHTVFCPDRFTASKFFSPNIDINLMPRFLQLLSPDERYMLCLSSPATFSFDIIKPFKVTYKKEVSAPDMKKLPSCNVFVADSAFIQNNSRRYHTYHFNVSYSLGNLKDITFHIRHLEIQQSSILSTEILQLLSSKTKILKCTKVEFLWELAFHKILKTAPYLEEIDIPQTNVRKTISWPDDLLQLNHATKLKHVHVKSGFDFNIEKLTTLMKERSVNISLSVVSSPFDRYFESTITRKLSPHFVTSIFNFTTLTIYVVDESFNVIDTKKFVLKNV